MEYREIVAITGLSGLYQLLTTKSDGAIVRNIADKSTKFISARQHNVTPLESIEVYTTGDNVRLQDVFQKMQDQETTIPLADAKTADPAGIKNYFKSIFPEFDEDRVYVSDMKKMLKWYELLKGNDLLNFEAEPEESAEENAEENGGTTEETAAADAEPTAKKAKAKKAETEDEGTVEDKPKKTEAEDETAGEEKPKKAAKKKKAEGEADAAEEKAPKKTAKKKNTDGE